MELLVILGVLFVLAGPVGLIVAIVAYRRAGKLRREMWEMLAQQAPATEAAPSAPVAESAVISPPPAVRPPVPAPVAARPQPPKAAPAAPRPKRQAVDFESILGGQWLTWAGILALFFGTAFFLGVDLGEGGLSGLPQILIGLAVAAVFGFVGHRLSSRAERFLGLGLLGGAVALLFLAMFAAYGFHHLVPLVVVFPLLLVVATVGALLALNRDSLTIASLTLVGAFLTPVVMLGLNNDASVYDAVLPYIVAVNVGAVLVGLRRGWAGLPLGAFISSLLLVTSWWNWQPRQDLWSFLSVSGSWLVFAAAPWLQREATRFWSLARAGVLTANGLFYALFCHEMLTAGGTGAQGGMLVGLAMIYYTMSIQMKSRRGEDPASRLAHTTAAALALMAVPVLLDAAWVTIGWTVLAGILLMSGLREKDFWQRATGLAVLVIGMFRVAFLDVPSSRDTVKGFLPLINGDFLAGLAALGLMGWIFWAYHRYEDRLRPAELKWRSSFLVVAISTLVWKLSAELAAYFQWRQNVHGVEAEPDQWLWMALLWTACGLATILIGLRTRYLPLRRPGYVFLSVALTGTVLFSLGQGVDLVQAYRPIFNLPFLQGAVLAAALGVLAWRVKRSPSDLGPTERSLSTPLMLVAILLMFVKVSLEVLAYFKLGGAGAAANQVLKSQLTLSVVWGLYAGAVIAVGFARRFKPVRLLGMSLLGLTVLKVFLVDMQSLARGYRIAAFVALGVLLLGISLLYQRERRSELEVEE